jgi:hypothetical protein
VTKFVPEVKVAKPFKLKLPEKSSIVVPQMHTQQNKDTRKKPKLYLPQRKVPTVMVEAPEEKL